MFTAESAGVGAVDGTPPSLLAVLEMKRRGIDIAPHRARNISSVTVADYEIVVALDREVAALFWAALPGTSRICGSGMFRIRTAARPGNTAKRRIDIHAMSRNLFTTCKLSFPCFYSGFLSFPVPTSSPQFPLPLPVSREGGEGCRSHGIPRPRPAKACPRAAGHFRLLEVPSLRSGGRGGASGAKAGRGG